MTITMSGAKILPAERDTVWNALNDTDSLKLCIPGCRSLARVSPDAYALTVLVTLGPVRLAFCGEVEILQSVPSSSLVLRGRGQGGLAGLAVGSARLDLTDTEGGVRLAYTVEAEPRGPLATLGALFIGGVARTLVDQFISSLASICGHGRLAGDERHPVGPTRPS